jgi:hypothetical protein
MYVQALIAKMAADEKTKQSPLTELRAGRTSRGHSEERSENEGASAGSPTLEAFHGHIPIRSEKQLLVICARMHKYFFVASNVGCFSATL